MALKIRKQYKNPDGTVTEVEGSEKEIREYDERIRSAVKNVNEVPTKKKSVLLG